MTTVFICITTCLNATWFIDFADVRAKNYYNIDTEIIEIRPSVKHVMTRIKQSFRFVCMVFIWVKRYRTSADPMFQGHWGRSITVYVNDQIGCERLISPTKFNRDLSAGIRFADRCHQGGEVGDGCTIET